MISKAKCMSVVLLAISFFSYSSSSSSFIAIKVKTH
jgi:hypothetical protein